MYYWYQNLSLQFFIYLTVLYNNNHNMHLLDNYFYYYISTNNVSIYTKALVHIHVYNCPCVDLLPFFFLFSFLLQKLWLIFFLYMQNLQCRANFSCKLWCLLFFDRLSFQIDGIFTTKVQEVLSGATTAAKNLHILACIKTRWIYLNLQHRILYAVYIFS